MSKPNRKQWSDEAWRLRKKRRRQLAEDAFLLVAVTVLFIAALYAEWNQGEVAPTVLGQNVETLGFENFPLGLLKKRIIPQTGYR
jgi:hypothetical protein